jgi:psp operon transcriptional activator
MGVTSPGVTAPRVAGFDLRSQVEAFEIDRIQRALSAARFNQRRAAESLGLTYDQLRGYLRKYNLTGNGRNGRDSDPDRGDTG